MRAISVLENAKSNRHRKTHRVDPDGTGRKFMHLTRGDLPRESEGEVSRGRSSLEGRENVWSEGPKDQKKGDQRIDRCGVSAEKHRETTWESRAKAADPRAGRDLDGGSIWENRTGGGKSPAARKGVKEDA